MDLFRPDGARCPGAAGGIAVLIRLQFGYRIDGAGGEVSQQNAAAVFQGEISAPSGEMEAAELSLQGGIQKDFKVEGSVRLPGGAGDGFSNDQAAGGQGRRLRLVLYIVKQGLMDLVCPDGARCPGAAGYISVLIRVQLGHPIARAGGEIAQKNAVRVLQGKVSSSPGQLKGAELTLQGSIQGHVEAEEALRLPGGAGDGLSNGQSAGVNRGRRDISPVPVMELHGYDLIGQDDAGVPVAGGLVSVLIGVQLPHPVGGSCREIGQENALSVFQGELGTASREVQLPELTVQFRLQVHLKSEVTGLVCGGVEHGFGNLKGSGLHGRRQSFVGDGAHRSDVLLNPPGLTAEGGFIFFRGYIQGMDRIAEIDGDAGGGLLLPVFQGEFRVTAGELHLTELTGDIIMTRVLGEVNGKTKRPVSVRTGPGHMILNREISCLLYGFDGDFVVGAPGKVAVYAGDGVKPLKICRLSVSLHPDIGGIKRIQRVHGSDADGGPFGQTGCSSGLVMAQEEV